jgi:hypothetical protein
VPTARRAAGFHSLDVDEAQVAIGRGAGQDVRATKLAWVANRFDVHMNAVSFFIARG